MWRSLKNKRKDKNNAISVFVADNYGLALTDFIIFVLGFCFVSSRISGVRLLLRLFDFVLLDIVSDCLIYVKIVCQ